MIVLNEFSLLGYIRGEDQRYQGGTQDQKLLGHGYRDSLEPLLGQVKVILRDTKP